MADTDALPKDDKGEAKPSTPGKPKGEAEAPQEGGQPSGEQPKAPKKKKEKKQEGALAAPEKTGEASADNKGGSPGKSSQAPEETGGEKPAADSSDSQPEPQPKPRKKAAAQKDAPKKEGETQKQEPEKTGDATQKKGIFAKLSEKLKKKPKEEKPAEKKEEAPKAEKKEGLLKRLFKKKEKQEEEAPISLAPTIVTSKPAPEKTVDYTEAIAPKQTPKEAGIITPTVAPVPQLTFFQRAKQLFKKQLPQPLEIPTHCAVCGIDLHTVYSYTCSNCRMVACYYCTRTFNGKTYCTRCLKEKGIL